MYVNVRQHTTMYNMLRQHIRQCTTMFAEKYFPTTEFLSHPKVLHVKLFFLIRSIAYENLRLTANNHDTSRQHSNNYDFFIRTLSHLKIRMWESSISVRKCTSMYDNIRQCTTCCDSIFDNVQQCSPKNTSLRQNFCCTQKFYM